MQILTSIDYIYQFVNILSLLSFLKKLIGVDTFCWYINLHTRCASFDFYLFIFICFIFGYFNFLLCNIYFYIEKSMAN